MQALLKELEPQAYPEPPSKGPLTLSWTLKVCEIMVFMAVNYGFRAITYFGGLGYPKTLNPLPEANAFAAVLEEHGRQDLLAKADMEILCLKRVWGLEFWAHRLSDVSCLRLRGIGFVVQVEGGGVLPDFGFRAFGRDLARFSRGLGIQTLYPAAGKELRKLKSWDPSSTSETKPCSRQKLTGS